MIFLYILAGLLTLILVLLCLPVQIELKYSEQLSIRIKYLFIPFQIIPKKEKSDRRQPKSKAGKFIRSFWDKYCAQHWKKLKSGAVKLIRKIKLRLRWVKKWLREKLGSKHEKAPREVKAKPAEKEKSSFAQLREARGFSGMVALLWRVVSLAGGAFGKVMRGITVQRFDFTAKIGGEDAAETAVSYGKWCAVLYPVLSFILGSTRRYNKNIDITPDFSGGETRVEAEAQLYVMPVMLLTHSAGAFLKLLFLEIKDAVKQKMDDASAEASQNIKQGGAL